MKKLTWLILAVLVFGGGSTPVRADTLPPAKAGWQIGEAPTPIPTPVMPSRAHHKKKKWGMNGSGWTRPMNFGPILTPTPSPSPTPTTFIPTGSAGLN